MLGLCGTWIVCLLISMPPVFRLVSYTYQPGLPVCTTDFSKGRATIFYTIFYTAITLVLPGVIILGCNIKVSFNFWNMSYKHIPNNNTKSVKIDKIISKVSNFLYIYWILTCEWLSFHIQLWKKTLSRIKREHGKIYLKKIMFL